MVHQYRKFKKWVERKKIQKRLDKFMIAWIISIAIISIGLFNLDYAKILGVSIEKETSLITFPSPTIQQLSPTPTYTQPTLAPKVYVPTPTTDPDPIISCNYQYLGAQQIKRSLCNTQFECQLGFKWYFYTSREKCKQDQNAMDANARKPNSVPPQGTAQNLILENSKNNAKYMAAQSCISLAKLKADSCGKACSDAWYQDFGICQFGRDNGVWETDRYGECTAEIDKKSSDCQNGCTNDMMAQQNQCLEDQKK